MFSVDISRQPHAPLTKSGIKDQSCSSPPIVFEQKFFIRNQCSLLHFELMIVRHSLSVFCEPVLRISSHKTIFMSYIFYACITVAYMQTSLYTIYCVQPTTIQFVQSLKYKIRFLNSMYACKQNKAQQHWPFLSFQSPSEQVNVSRVYATFNLWISHF